MSRSEASREPGTPRPWYRHAWPWLLMVMPALAIVGGSVTFWLAATTNNSLVVDDYYREGRAINLELARDRRAVEMGLTGSLARAADGSPRLQLAANAGVALPAAVTLKLVHVTRSELDATLVLYAAGEGVYRAAGGALPGTGRWNVQIEDPERRWRLVGESKDAFGEPVPFGK
jgi:hypothetical protein